MSPQHYMTSLDKEGTAYWLEDLTVVIDEPLTHTPVEKRKRFPQRFDVVHFTWEWLALREVDTDNDLLFVAVSKVVSVRVVKG